jgi:hypothetical protein
MRDDHVLRAIGAYQFLLADQVRRLLGYRAGSRDYVRALLKRLVDGEALARIRLPRASAGNAYWVYLLGKRGHEYLTTVGGDEFSELRRFRGSESFERSYLFLAHTLAVNDVLIAATLLPRQEPAVTLARMRFERELKRTPVRVVTGPQQRQVVIPDGWLEFHLRGESRLCVALELDRATEEEGAFKRKARSLLAYAAGPYQEAFGVDSLTVAFVTTGGPRREARMRAWCEQTLREQARERDADLFYLTELPSGEPDPHALFLSPIWSRPFATDRAPLLEM